jgi:hypothetical protein
MVMGQGTYVETRLRLSSAPCTQHPQPLRRCYTELRRARGPSAGCLRSSATSTAWRRRPLEPPRASLPRPRRPKDGGTYSAIAGRPPRHRKPLPSRRRDGRLSHRRRAWLRKHRPTRVPLPGFEPCAARTAIPALEALASPEPTQPNFGSERAAACSFGCSASRRTPGAPGRLLGVSGRSRIVARSTVQHPSWAKVRCRDAVGAPQLCGYCDPDPYASVSPQGALCNSCVVSLCLLTR